MALSSTGSSHTYHLAPSVSDVITLSRPYTPPPVASSRLRSRSSAFYHVHYPLSTLISSLSLYHHLYAHDTQLFSSFYPANFDSSITHLQNYPSSNLFLDDCQSPNSQLLQDRILITHWTQKARYTTPHLTPLTLFATLASSLTNILLFLTKFRQCPKLAIVAYHPLVELVALFALMPKYTRRTIGFFHPRVRFLRDHFSTQGRLA